MLKIFSSFILLLVLFSSALSDEISDSLEKVKSDTVIQLTEPFVIDSNLVNS